MFNQEMQNAQESAEAETPARLKRKYSSIFRSLQFSSPWAANIPNQQTGTTTTSENCKNSWLQSSPNCPRYRHYSSANRCTNHIIIIQKRAAKHWNRASDKKNWFYAPNGPPASIFYKNSWIFEKCKMFNQEMNNAQESAEAETPARLKRKYSSFFRSLHFSRPCAGNIPIQQTGTTTTS